VRIGFIRDRAAAHWQRDPLSGSRCRACRVLDIGCGGGCSANRWPARRRVTGIDAAAAQHRPRAVHAAAGPRDRLSRGHRRGAGRPGAQFDIVLALEIVEHVADVDLFLHSLGRLASPAAGVPVDAQPHRQGVGARHRRRRILLRWLPRGTHDWRKFLKPSKSCAACARRRRGRRRSWASSTARSSRAWSLDRRDLDVNYMLYGSKGVG
jgi:2-polyprenyl-6-hydroxyphenyl methylase/3-demethylubiquinone-9 3-methyltransferase